MSLCLCLCARAVRGKWTLGVFAFCADFGALFVSVYISVSVGVGLCTYLCL